MGAAYLVALHTPKNWMVSLQRQGVTTENQNFLACLAHLFDRLDRS
jgi:hypothetical protein